MYLGRDFTEKDANRQSIRGIPSADSPRCVCMRSNKQEFMANLSYLRCTLSIRCSVPLALFLSPLLDTPIHLSQSEAKTGLGFISQRPPGGVLGTSHPRRVLWRGTKDGEVARWGQEGCQVGAKLNSAWLRGSHGLTGMPRT